MFAWRLFYFNSVRMQIKVFYTYCKADSCLVQSSCDLYLFSFQKLKIRWLVWVLPAK